MVWQEEMSSIIEARANDDGRKWFSAALDRAIPDASPADFLIDFSSTSRFLGKQPLALSDAESARLREYGGQLLSAWCCDDLARLSLLLAMADQLNADRFFALVEECFRFSDHREHASLLRALPFLPDPGRWQFQATDACRTNIQSVFEAIACDNTYPEQHFSQHSFNHMVLKALFLGVRLYRIIGMDEKVDDDLARMALDYVEERENAGRTIPYELWRIVATSNEPRALPVADRYLVHDESQQRIAAAYALSIRSDSEGADRIQQRLEIESDERVRNALKAALRGECDWPSLFDNA